MTEPIYVLLTTYQRTETAIKTIQGIKENLRWDNIGWVITDDSTGGDHLQKLKDEIGSAYTVHTYDNGARKGVGHNMNWGLAKIFDELNANLVLVLEDDWYLHKPYNIAPCVKLLIEHQEYGMVRMGYLSPGLQADLVSEEKHLWWKFARNNETYIFSGHAALRHRRFHDVYGRYTEGMAPGLNELDFCAKFNAKDDGPAIVWDGEHGCWGPFAHIGGVSLADVEPEK